jgi:hypothetical protein
MKYLVILLGLFLVPCILSAKGQSVFDYYNSYVKANPEKTHPYTVSKTNDHYFTDSGLDYKIDVLVDIPNGYINFINPGTGAGSYVFEMAQFKTKDGKDVILVNETEYTAIGTIISTINCYKVVLGFWMNVTKNTIPDIRIVEFFDKDYFKKNQMKIFKFIEENNSNFLDRNYYQLPRYGTDIKGQINLKKFIKHFHYLENYRDLSDEGKQDISDMDENLKEDFLLKWDNEKGKFNLIVN